MKAFVRISALLFLTILPFQARAEDPVDFVKSQITREGAETWAFVTYPDNHLEVEFNLRPYAGTRAGAMMAFGSIAKQIVPVAFEKFPQIQAVHITADLHYIDKRGNDQTATAAMVQFSRKNSSSIRWDRVRDDDVIDIADHHSVDPSLTK